MSRRRRWTALAAVFGVAGVGGFVLGERLDPIGWLKRSVFGPGSQRFGRRLQEAMQQ